VLRRRFGAITARATRAPRKRALHRLFSSLLWSSQGLRWGIPPAKQPADSAGVQSAAKDPASERRKSSGQANTQLRSKSSSHTTPLVIPAAPRMRAARQCAPAPKLQRSQSNRTDRGGSTTPAPARLTPRAICARGRRFRVTLLLREGRKRNLTHHLRTTQHTATS